MLHGLKITLVIRAKMQLSASYVKPMAEFIVKVADFAKSTYAQL